MHARYNEEDELEYRMRLDQRRRRFEALEHVFNYTMANVLKDISKYADKYGWLSVTASVVTPDGRVSLVDRVKV